MKSYLDLLDDVMTNGESHDDRTGVGTVSVFGRQWRHDMRRGFPLLTTKKVPLRWVFEELRWFLSGSRDEVLLRMAGVDIWKEWATKEQTAKFNRDAFNLGPIYGPMMRAFPVGESPDDIERDGVWLKGHTPTKSYVDQIAELLHDIRHSPNSRRLIVTHWHPYYAKRVTLPPCHTLWQVKVHRVVDEGLGTAGSAGRSYELPSEMSLHLYARSIDAFLGLPFNIASYGLLLHMLCAVCGMTPRDLIISFGDLHVYKSHFDAVKTQLSREPRKLPNLSFTNIETLNAPHLTELTALLSIEWKHVKLDGYDPHPKIEAPVAI